MTWPDLVALFARHLLPSATVPAVDRWLGSLSGSTDGERLIICILIDALSNAVDSDRLLEVLMRLDASAADGCEAFARALESHPDYVSWLCSSRFQANDSPADDHYARVIGLRPFISHYVATVRPSVTLSLEDERRIRRRLARHRLPDDLGWPLGFVHAWWSARRDCVWVCSFREVTSLSHDSSDPATIIMDALGLVHYAGATPATELVLIKYPRGVALQAAQPTTFDADWGYAGGYYVSHPASDAWGRTQGVSGTTAPLRERVHHKFLGLTDQFRAYYIGPVATVTENPSQLLIAAHQRLEGMVLHESASE